jgi:hypothetical protein
MLEKHTWTQVRGLQSIRCACTQAVVEGKSPSPKGRKCFGVQILPHVPRKTRMYVYHSGRKLIGFIGMGKNASLTWWAVTSAVVIQDSLCISMVLCVVQKKERK